MAKQAQVLERTSKNLTKEEIEARSKAEASCLPARPKLKAPPVITRDKAAKRYWDLTLKRAADVDLLDLLDTDVLASYCAMLSRRDDLQAAYQLWKDEGSPGEIDFYTKLNNVEKNILSYAEKLGLTPSGRVRLARQRAEANLAGGLDEMFGD